MDLNACPECGKRVYRDDFQCASCGLLLHPEQASGEYILTDPAIVRAMLAPNEPRSSSTEEFLIPEELPPPTATAAYPLPLLFDGCPQLMVKLDNPKKPLQPYEAHIAAHIDGESTVPQIARACGVPLAEVRAVIVSLYARGVVDFQPDRQPKAVGTKKNAAPPAAPAPASKRQTEPVPIEEVPTNRRAKKAAAAPPPAPPKFSEALKKMEPPPQQPAIRGFAKAAVEKALEEARARKNQPLQERHAVVLDSPDEFIQRAVALERAGQVDGAIYVLRRAIERMKKPAPLYNKLALILLDKRRDYKQAELLLRQALKTDPSNTVYQQNLYTVLTLAAESGSGKIPAAGLWSRLRRK